MKLVYIAGPFRGPDHWAIECNIRRAESLALEVWRLGAAALCPHMNTRHFQGVLPDAIWLKGDLEMVKRCDAVLMVQGWEKSEGAATEAAWANSLGIPVFESLDKLRFWLTAELPVIAMPAGYAYWNGQRSTTEPPCDMYLGPCRCGQDHYGAQDFPRVAEEVFNERAV